VRRTVPHFGRMAFAQPPGDLLWWPILFEAAGGATLGVKPILLAVAMCCGFLVLVLLWARAPRIDAPIGRSALIPLGAAVATWAFTTATHATSQKYIDEIKVPGQVYLYYAVAVVWVAILLAWGVLAAVSRLPSTVRMASLNLLGAFLMIQMPLNWQLASTTANAWAPNRALVAASTDRVAPAKRCATLLAWAERPRPVYYRDTIVAHAQESFALKFGSDLCPDASTLAEIATLDR